MRSGRESIPGLLAGVLRVWLVAVALCCSTIPTGIAAADVPELAGVTVVEADGAAMIDVRVATPFDVFPADEDRAPAATFEGGPVVVADLHRLGSATQFGPERLEFYRLGRPGSFWTQWSGVNYLRSQDSSVVPAGVYRLYLLGTGPTRVTLRIPQLEGEVLLRPRRATSFSGGYLPALAAGLPGTTVFGGKGTLGGDGFMRLFASFDEPQDPNVDRLEVCTYDGHEAASAADAFQPGCPGGSGSDEAYPTWDEPLRAMHSWVGFGPGDYGIGVNTTRAGDARGGFAVAYWHTPDDHAPIEGDDAPGAPAPVAPPPPAPAAAPLQNRDEAAGVAVLARSRARQHGTRLAIRLACRASRACRGSVSAGTARAIAFNISPGATTTVRVPSPAALRRRVRRTGTGRTTLRLRSITADGHQEMRYRLTVRRR